MNPLLPTPPFPSRRRGATLVFVAVMLFVMFGFAVLAVDVGYICALTAESQNTSDAGALAGAWLLQEGHSENADERVLELIAKNQKTQGFLSLDDQVVEFGAWNSVTHTFTALDRDQWATGAFATRVRHYRSNAKLFFAAILGKPQTTVWREAVAVGSRGCRGIWGLEGVRVNGNIETDSFNSDLALYDPGRPMENGDVCSGRGIDGMGSFEIHGDAMTGLGYDFEISGAAHAITGVTTSQIDGIQEPPADMGDAAYENDNDALLSEGRGSRLFRTGGLNLTMEASANLRLPPGTYYFDSISIQGDARITITGPTTIYVAGNIDETGKGFVNSTEDPSNLMIVSGGSQVRLNGSSAFYGQVLAPDAEVFLGGTSDFYGEVIGETVWMLGDFQFHVDESSPLLNLMDSPVPPMLVR